LVVALERGQILLHAPTECRKAVAQTLEAPLQRTVEALLDDIRETVGARGTHWHKPEYAAIAEVQLQRGQARRSDWSDAAPVHGA
jgi:hypothetical protein